MQERRKRSNDGSGERRAGDAARIEEALKDRGRVSLRVHGTSMLPLVRPGDIALIRRDKLENMRPGDIVLFQRDSQLIAQRIGEDELTSDPSPLATTGDQPECLGQIIRVCGASDQIEMEAEEDRVVKK